MATSPAVVSLFSSDELDEDVLLDPNLIDLLDRRSTDIEGASATPATPLSSSTATAIHRTPSSQPIPITSISSHSPSSLTFPLPSTSTPTTRPATFSVSQPTSILQPPPAATESHSDLVPASYASLAYSLPAHVPMPHTGWSLLHSPPPVLSFGCPHLDALLGGGLRPQVIELVGEAGAAKSQLCFQLLLQVQLSLPPPPPEARHSLSHYGLDGCGYYVTTEGRPPMVRLAQMQESMHRRCEWTRDHDFLASLFVQEAHSVEALLALVEQLAADSVRVREQRVRLLVIDSVAGLFRVDDEVAFAHSAIRSDAQFRLSAALRRLSGQQQVVVVVCNQVTDRFMPAEGILRSSETYRDRYAITTSGRQVMPALGLSWANCIDTRIAVSRRDRGRGGGGGGGGGGMVLDGSEVQREMEVVFAPHLPRRSMHFVVDADGVRGREGTMKPSGGIETGDEWTAGRATKAEQQQQQQQSAVGTTGRAPLTPISVNVPVSERATPTKRVR